MLAVSDLLTVCDWPMRWLFVGVASCYEKSNAPLVFVVLILMRWNSALHRRRVNLFFTPTPKNTPLHPKSQNLRNLTKVRAPSRAVSSKRLYHGKTSGLTTNLTNRILHNITAGVRRDPIKGKECQRERRRDTRLQLARQTSFLVTGQPSAYPQLNFLFSC